MSSPRQKMVVVAAPPPNELEQRKKRQTLERAKANHVCLLLFQPVPAVLNSTPHTYQLSKQLQMRLQYAKLKVEHGWVRSIPLVVIVVVAAHRSALSATTKS